MFIVKCFNCRFVSLVSFYVYMFFNFQVFEIFFFHYCSFVYSYDGDNTLSKIEQSLVTIVLKQIKQKKNKMVLLCRNKCKKGYFKPK